MLSENDLQVAVDRGIISREQFDQLERFAAERDKALHQVVRDEAPRFVRSFGDLFVAIGVVFFAFGLMFVSNALSGDGLKSAFLILCPVIIWALAEWITGRLRLSGPSIVLAISFVSFLVPDAMLFAKLVLGSSFDSDDALRKLIVISFCIAGNFLFYWRFRLPFCLLIFGVLACLFTVFGVELAFPNAGFDVARWVLLASGLGLFIFAMWFDLQDPTRSGRSSDAAFWLHLVSAPIIVHSALFGAVPWGSFDKAFGGVTDFSSELVALSAGLLVIFAFIAVLIDRRAFLVSSLSYTGAVIGYAIWSLKLPQETIFAATFIFLAALVLTLGTGWRHIRAFLFRFLPQTGFTRYLPPVDA